MNISVKKFSKKSLSLLIALIMVFSALPLTPPISADAAEVKTNIDVWDANNATVELNSNPRYSFKDSDTEYSLSGVRWGGSTLNTNSSDNTKYLTIGNASLSCATLSSSNESTPPTASGFAGKNIKGKKWSFSANFAYTGPNTSGTYTATTVFGIGTSDTYTYANKSSNYNETDSMVANLVDIRENGNIYIALSNETSTTINPTLTLSEENRNKLATDSASNPKVLTVTYDNGYLSIDINGDVIVAPREVDSALFEKGVSNFFMGPNVQVYRGGTAPYYKVTSDGAYIYNMNLYSLSGATYTTKTSHDNPNQTINVAGFGVVKHSSSNANRKIDNNTINIVNDRYHNNFDIGFINFNISGLKNSNYVSVKNAICAFQARYADRDDNKGLKLYYPTKNVTEFTTNSAAIPGNATAVQLTPSNSASNSIFSSDQGANSTHLAKTIEYYGLTAIPSGEFTVNNSYADKSLDISEAINYALRNNLDYATVIILLKEAGNATNSGSRNWTDTYFKFTSSSITATAVDACIWNDYHPDPANAGQHIRECEVCHKTETQNHDFDFLVNSQLLITVPENGDENGYRYVKCLNCDAIDTSKGVNGYVYIDVSSYWETYNAQLTQSQDKIENTAKYTRDSIKAVQDIIDDVAPVKDSPTKSQRYIQDKTRALATATNSLVLRQYSITVNYVDENGNDLAVGEGGTTSKTYPAVDYGSIQNVVAPTNYNKVDYAVYKWTREDKSNSSISGLNSSSLDVVVKGASTYYVFLKNTSVDESQASGKAVVTINNKSNKIFDIGYIDLNENTPVSVSKNTITIGTVTLTAPVYSFYNITGFDVNGKIITGTDTVSITKNTVIRPVYTPSHTVTITRATGSNFLINGKDVDSVEADWNKKIVMTYNGEVPVGQVVIWKDGNGNILAQGTTYSFYANSDVTISATVEASAPTDPTASIGLFTYDANENKVTVVNNFFVPEGLTAVKAGVVLSTKTDNIDTLKEQKTGRFEGTADKFSGTDTNKNQIRISVTRTATTSFTMHALAYVVVEDGNGNTETYYAPTVRSITYPANTTA